MLIQDCVLYGWCLSEWCPFRIVSNSDNVPIWDDLSIRDDVSIRDHVHSEACLFGQLFGYRGRL